MATLALNAATVAFQSRSQVWSNLAARLVLPLLLDLPAQLDERGLVRLLGAAGTLIWLAHVQSVTETPWDSEQAAVLSCLDVPARFAGSAEVDRVRDEMQRARELPK